MASNERAILQIQIEDDDSDGGDILFVSSRRNMGANSSSTSSSTSSSSRRSKRKRGIVRACSTSTSNKRQWKDASGTVEVQVLTSRVARRTRNHINTSLGEKALIEIDSSSEDEGEKTTDDLGGKFLPKPHSCRGSLIEVLDDVPQKTRCKGSAQTESYSKKGIESTEDKKENERSTYCKRSTVVCPHSRTKADIEMMNDSNVSFSSKKNNESLAAITHLHTTKLDISSDDYAVALALQKSQEQSIIDTSDQDQKLAQKLQEEEDERLRRTKHFFEETIEADTVLAQFLQKEEDEKVPPKADPTKEQMEMTKSSSGKAVVIVQRVIQLVQDSQNNLHPQLASLIDAVAIDDMVFLAEKMLEQQQEFKHTNIPSYIDIGFHYTNSKNMEDIRTNGLLTRAEQKHQNVKSARMNGSVFGDGVYTANNPTSFQNYGDLGLLVGRLQGNTIQIPRSLGSAGRSNIKAANTIVGDKLINGERLDRNGWPIRDLYHEVVLRSSSQCLPMVRFDSHIIQKQQGKQCIEYFQASLQRILDEVVNYTTHKQATASRRL